MIADDSDEPLQIVGMTNSDVILHLPFNSGLSQGLIKAIEEVQTPYVMRMDVNGKPSPVGEENRRPFKGGNTG